MFPPFTLRSDSLSQSVKLILVRKGVAGDLWECEIWVFAHFLAYHFSLTLLHIALDLPHIIRESSYCSVKLHKMKFRYDDLKVQLLVFCIRL